MKDKPIIDAMKEAARRTFEWHAIHGIMATWELNERGLELRASYGGHNALRTVSWCELERAEVDAGRLLELNEQAALHALSS